MHSIENKSKPQILGLSNSLRQLLQTYSKRKKKNVQRSKGEKKKVLKNGQGMSREKCK